MWADAAGGLTPLFDSVGELVNFGSLVKGYGVEVKMRMRGNNVYVLSLAVGDRGKGHAGAFLKMLCGWADEEKKTVILRPSGIFGSEVGRLKEMYGRFGFRESGQKLDEKERAMVRHYEKVSKMGS